MNNWSVVTLEKDVHGDIWVARGVGDENPAMVYYPESLLEQVEEELTRRMNVDQPEKGADGWEYASGRYHAFRACYDLLRSKREEATDG